jgi:hypothetical protein
MRACMGLALRERGTGYHLLFLASRMMMEAPGVEPESENRPRTGMGMITQPQW